MDREVNNSSIVQQAARVLTRAEALELVVWHFNCIPTGWVSRDLHSGTRLASEVRARTKMQTRMFYIAFRYLSDEVHHVHVYE